MLIPALFIINNVIEKESYSIYPYIHTFTNNVNFEGLIIFLIIKRLILNL